MFLKFLASRPALFTGSLPKPISFRFHKRSQLFIRSHNETLPVAAMRVCNPDGSSFAIDG
jgi:hypothetical protein